MTRQHRRRMTLPAASVAVVAGMLSMCAWASDDPPAPVRYRPPVSAPVVDPFRAPLTWYGPGNRGIDYDTTLVGSVASIGVGTVTFAGPVAGRLVVVVTHPDGLRSTYTGLGSIEVRAGQIVQLGQRLGAAASTLHLGLRSGSTYLDPARYFTPWRRHAVLVGPHVPASPRPSIPAPP